MSFLLNDNGKLSTGRVLSLLIGIGGIVYAFVNHADPNIISMTGLFFATATGIKLGQNNQESKSK